MVSRRILLGLTLLGFLALSAPVTAHLVTWGSWQITHRNLMKLYPDADPFAWWIKRHTYSDAEAARARLADYRAGLHRSSRHGRFETAIGWLEGWVDFLDTIRRHRRAHQVMRDLITRRISHVRAAQVMRGLDARAKGGWLLKRLR